MLKTVANGAGNVTQLTGYTSLGDVTSIVQTPESGTDITTSFTYDGAQRVLSETLPDSKQLTYAYNYRKLATSTDEAGNETAFSFCAICGKLTGIGMPLSKSLSWQEDGDHLTTGFTDALSNQTAYTYGNAGELKQTTYPDSSKTIYRYDNYGRPIPLAGLVLSLTASLMWEIKCFPAGFCTSVRRTGAPAPNRFGAARLRACSRVPAPTTVSGSLAPGGKCH
jgi:YD repeat-containing protein